MKAILKYPGSKWRIADWVISFFPEHHSYLEPFFGSGATSEETEQHRDHQRFGWWGCELL